MNQGDQGFSPRARGGTAPGRGAVNGPDASGWAGFVCRCEKAGDPDSSFSLRKRDYPRASAEIPVHVPERGFLKGEPPKATYRRLLMA